MNKANLAEDMTRYIALPTVNPPYRVSGGNKPPDNIVSTATNPATLSTIRQHCSFWPDYPLIEMCAISGCSLMLTGDLTSDNSLYVIVSHTWSPKDEKVTFSDIMKARDSTKTGIERSSSVLSRPLPMDFNISG